MIDLQIGDRIETNEGACELARPETLLTGMPKPGQTAYYKAGERGRITAIDYADCQPYLVHITFDSGEYDVLYAEDVDLLYRPINDPALYDRSLLDLVEAAKWGKLMAYTGDPDKYNKHLYRLFKRQAKIAKGKQS